MRSLVMVCLMMACLLFQAPAQAQQREIGQYVVLPPRDVLVTVTSQPNCPLKIEDADFLYRVDKPGMMLRYKVRNVSEKPISLFILDKWNSDSGGGTLTLWDAGARSRQALMPGETLELQREGIDYKLTPLTNDLRNKLNLKNELQILYVLLVNEVDFVDGSV
ncbi:MAG TPA: hypothetical protein VN843_27840, partial [Anaerolineales bacterium]|nr:hypothetical protein [Anaerolineales bacterium]